MNAAWKIGRIAGIELKIHWTFWLLFVWIAFVASGSGGGTAMFIYTAALIVCVFACVVLHELGHALTARRFGIQTQDITLLPIGGVARLRRLPEDPKQEMLIAIAGPVVNVAIAAVLFVVLLIMGAVNNVVPERFDVVQATLANFIINLLWVNVIIVAFNLLPAFPMDGGRLLRAFLATKMDRLKATDAAAAIGQGMAMLFALAAVLTSHLWLLFIALFVFIAAGGEAQQARMQEAIRDVRVADAMMSEFHTLRVNDTLEQAADALLAGSQQDFPVVDDGGVQGMLFRQKLFEALTTGDRQQQVGGAMQPVSERLDASESLTHALELMRSLNLSSMPVFRGDQLVGLLSMENVGEYVVLRSALRKAAEAAG